MSDLELVLSIVIILITINLLFVGGYITLVLRDVRKTVRKANAVIDDVDGSIKDGFEKAKAMEVPLQALATTATALTGIIKGSGIVRRKTETILRTDIEPEPEVQKGKATVETQTIASGSTNSRRPRFFRKK